MKWLASSSHTSPSDFCLWGYLKNAIFEQQPTTRADMQDRIRRACAAIPRQTLQNTVRHFQRRLTMYLEANGRHFYNLTIIKHPEQ